MKARVKPPAHVEATISEFDGVRFLHLGSTPWVQGAMRLARPAALELEYVQRMMAWMLLRPEGEATKGHAVQLGLGAGAITRFCHGTLRMRTTAVEFNPKVVDACRLWFRLPADSARLQVLEDDAAAFVADAARAGSVQALCVDLYDHEAAGPTVDTESFYRDCHRLLGTGGSMSVNLFGRDASFANSAGRIAAAFGTDRVRSLRPTREGNTIVVAVKDTDIPDRATLAERAAAVEARCALPASKWLKMLRPLPVPSATAISIDPPPAARGTLEP